MTTRCKRRSHRRIRPLRTVGHPATLLMSQSPLETWWTLRFDGSCSGNGEVDATGRWACELVSPTGESIIASGPSTGVVTVNTSEWEGCLSGLLRAASVSLTGGLLIEGDSLLVISQLNGKWRCRNHLLEFRDKSLDVLSQVGLPWCARWIPREANSFCDSITREESR